MTPRLSRKLVLEGRPAMPDGSGGRAGAWEVLGTHWAMVQARTGRFEAGEAFPRARVPYKITLRSVPPDTPSRPEPGQRFVEGARVYHIRAVADEATDARYLICFADEEVVA